MRSYILCLLFCGAVCSMTRGEVADSAPNGFTIKITQTIHSSREEVYRRLIQVGNWWNSAHTYSGDAHNLSIEEKAGGCFCETLKDGGSAQHMTVLLVRPGQLLRMGGGLGPLQGIASAGSMTIELSPIEGGTQMKIVYSVAGYLPGGMAAWADPVDSVLTEQFTRLKNYAERGDATKGPRPS
jgi:uncharacterized protein YndB with AHSA1/START domain